MFAYWVILYAFATAHFSKIKFFKSYFSNTTRCKNKCKWHWSSVPRLGPTVYQA